MAKYSLYNGVKLPTVDTERFYPTYPYVLITQSDDWYEVLITDSPSQVEYEYTPSGDFVSATLNNYGNGYRSIMGRTDDAWGNYNAVSPENGSVISGVTDYKVLADGYEGQEQVSLVVVWSNYDIRYDNGNLYRNAGDDPVPVDDEDPEDEKTFDLESFKIGLALCLAGNPLPLAQKEPVQTTNKE